MYICSRMGYLAIYPMDRSHPQLRGNTEEELKSKQKLGGMRAQPIMPAGRKTLYGQEVNYGQGTSIVYKKPERYPWKFLEGVQPRTRARAGTAGAQRRKQRVPQILPADEFLRPKPAKRPKL